MSAVATLFSKTLLHYLIEEFKLRYRFKYVLPRLREIELDGLRLDVSSLSSKVRNRLLSGAYEVHEKGMCHDFLRADDRVLEIGAAIGFIGLICQKKLGISDYACFEANPNTMEVLKRNYELNGVKARVWNMALAHSDGEVELETGSDFWENSIVSSLQGNEGRRTVRVPAATMQTLFRMAGFVPNVLIIDIEGAEQFIDFAQTPVSVNKIIIELHPAVIGQEATYNIVASLIAQGFRVAREESDTFVFLRK